MLRFDVGGGWEITLSVGVALHDYSTYLHSAWFLVGKASILVSKYLMSDNFCNLKITHHMIFDFDNFP